MHFASTTAPPPPPPIPFTAFLRAYAQRAAHRGGHDAEEEEAAARETHLFAAEARPPSSRSSLGKEADGEVTLSASFPIVLAQHSAQLRRRLKARTWEVEWTRAVVRQWLSHPTAASVSSSCAILNAAEEEEEEEETLRQHYNWGMEEEEEGRWERRRRRMALPQESSTAGASPTLNANEGNEMSPRRSHHHERRKKNHTKRKCPTDASFASSLSFSTIVMALWEVLQRIRKDCQYALPQSVRVRARMLEPHTPALPSSSSSFAPVEGIHDVLLLCQQWGVLLEVVLKDIVSVMQHGSGGSGRDGPHVALLRPHPLFFSSSSALSPPILPLTSSRDVPTHDKTILPKRTPTMKKGVATAKEHEKGKSTISAATCGVSFGGGVEGHPAPLHSEVPTVEWPALGEEVEAAWTSLLDLHATISTLWTRLSSGTPPTSSSSSFFSPSPPSPYVLAWSLVAVHAVSCCFGRPTCMTPPPRSSSFSSSSLLSCSAVRRGLTQWSRLFSPASSLPTACDGGTGSVADGLFTEAMWGSFPTVVLHTIGYLAAREGDMVVVRNVRMRIQEMEQNACIPKKNEMEERQGGENPNETNVDPLYASSLTCRSSFLADWMRHTPANLRHIEAEWEAYQARQEDEEGTNTQHASTLHAEEMGCPRLSSSSSSSSRPVSREVHRLMHVLVSMAASPWRAVWSRSSLTAPPASSSSSSLCVEEEGAASCPPLWFALQPLPSVATWEALLDTFFPATPKTAADVHDENFSEDCPVQVTLFAEQKANASHTRHEKGEETSSTPMEVVLSTPLQVWQRITTIATAAASSSFFLFFSAVSPAVAHHHHHHHSPSPAVAWQTLRRLVCLVHLYMWAEYASSSSFFWPEMDTTRPPPPPPAWWHRSRPSLSVVERWGWEDIMVASSILSDAFTAFSLSPACPLPDAQRVLLPSTITSASSSSSLPTIHTTPTRTKKRKVPHEAEFGLTHLDALRIAVQLLHEPILSCSSSSSCGGGGDVISPPPPLVGRLATLPILHLLFQAYTSLVHQHLPHSNPLLVGTPPSPFTPSRPSSSLPSTGFFSCHATREVRRWLEMSRTATVVVVAMGGGGGEGEPSHSSWPSIPRRRRDREVPQPHDPLASSEEKYPQGSTNARLVPTLLPTTTTGTTVLLPYWWWMYALSHLGGALLAAEGEVLHDVWSPLPFVCAVPWHTTQVPSCTLAERWAKALLAIFQEEKKKMLHATHITTPTGAESGARDFLWAGAERERRTEPLLHTATTPLFEKAAPCPAAVGERRRTGQLRTGGTPPFSAFSFPTALSRAFPLLSTSLSLLVALSPFLSAFTVGHVVEVQQVLLLAPLPPERRRTPTQERTTTPCPPDHAIRHRPAVGNAGEGVNRVQTTTTPALLWKAERVPWGLESLLSAPQAVALLPHLLPGSAAHVHLLRLLTERHGPDTAREALRRSWRWRVGLPTAALPEEAEADPSSSLSIPTDDPIPTTRSTTSTSRQRSSFSDGQPSPHARFLRWDVWRSIPWEMLMETPFWGVPVGRMKGSKEAENEVDPRRWEYCTNRTNALRCSSGVAWARYRTRVDHGGEAWQTTHASWEHHRLHRLLTMTWEDALAIAQRLSPTNLHEKIPTTNQMGPTEPKDCLPEGQDAFSPQRGEERRQPAAPLWPRKEEEEEVDMGLAGHVLRVLLHHSHAWWELKEDARRALFQRAMGGGSGGQPTQGKMYTPSPLLGRGGVGGPAEARMGEGGESRPPVSIVSLLLQSRSTTLVKELLSFALDHQRYRNGLSLYALLQDEWPLSWLRASPSLLPSPLPTPFFSLGSPTSLVPSWIGWSPLSPSSSFSVSSTTNDRPSPPPHRKVLHNGSTPDEASSNSSSSSVLHLGQQLYQRWAERNSQAQLMASMTLSAQQARWADVLHTFYAATTPDRRAGRRRGKAKEEAMATAHMNKKAADAKGEEEKEASERRETERQPLLIPAGNDTATNAASPLSRGSNEAEDEDEEDDFFVFPSLSSLVAGSSSSSSPAEAEREISFSFPPLTASSSTPPPPMSSAIPFSACGWTTLADFPLSLQRIVQYAQQQQQKQHPATSSTMNTTPPPPPHEVNPQETTRPSTLAHSPDATAHRVEADVSSRTVCPTTAAAVALRPSPPSTPTSAPFSSPVRSCRRRVEYATSRKLFHLFQNGHWQEGLKELSSAFQEGRLAHAHVSTLLAAMLHGRSSSPSSSSSSVSFLTDAVAKSDPTTPTTPSLSSFSSSSASSPPPSWLVTLHAFQYVAERLRPDVFAVVIAMEACWRGKQWKLARRLLSQAVLTQTHPPPRLLALFLQTCMHAGQAEVALAHAKAFEHTQHPEVLHAILQVLASQGRWGELMELFYQKTVEEEERNRAACQRKKEARQKHHITSTRLPNGGAEASASPAWTTTVASRVDIHDGASKKEKNESENDEDIPIGTSPYASSSSYSFTYDGGIRIREESNRLVLFASQRAGEEYRTLTGLVQAVCTGMEDVCELSGTLLEHVLLVCELWAAAAAASGGGSSGNNNTSSHHTGRSTTTAVFLSSSTSSSATMATHVSISYPCSTEAVPTTANGRERDREWVMGGEMQGEETVEKYGSDVSSSSSSFFASSGPGTGWKAPPTPAATRGRVEGRRLATKGPESVRTTTMAATSPARTSDEPRVGGSGGDSDVLFTADGGRTRRREDATSRKVSSAWVCPALWSHLAVDGGWEGVSASTTLY